VISKILLWKAEESDMWKTSDLGLIDNEGKLVLQGVKPEW
jgi:hypothetical protein